MALIVAALISFSISAYERWDWHVLDADFASDAVEGAKAEVAKTDKQVAKHKDRLEDIARVRAEENLASEKAEARGTCCRAEGRRDQLGKS